MKRPQTNNLTSPNLTTPHFQRFAKLVNPQITEPIQVPAKKAPKFRPEKGLREKVK
ncbi:HU family DNA-binding protein [Candidatus Aerophobetes bacterium]|nr:HU family DNA-binding protein [Candidatus Aerophobetes bacterium]